jgi:hypothetical protein
MNSLSCYRCGELGHFANMCPLLHPAASHDEHLSRITFYVDRWVGGLLSLEQKRCAIALENILWYGEAKCPKHLTYP